MSLTHLQIKNLRNIESARLDLHPHLNIVLGANGSGKTSFLEAVYLLGSGHSFRTREISPLVRQSSDCLTVFARTNDEQTISIQKSLLLPTQVRINSAVCQSSSELAYFLPCQVFYQDIFQIIDAGPSVRRSLLDWGLFHVKQSYHPLWKNYRRALKQRNSLLRQAASKKQLVPWDNMLIALSEQLNELRQQYFVLLNKEFQNLLSQLTDNKATLTYYKGWDRRESGKSLSAILADNHESDLHRQFTQYGAHQADLIVNCEDFHAKQYLSRGQQKIILFALKLAQAKLITKGCLYLCDDISSELDQSHISNLFELIRNTHGQFFITSIHVDSLHFAKILLITKRYLLKTVISHSKKFKAE
ncbi:DNA replication/repair protein RecF [Legionella tunisiensis]|uniref:DNA replication/repair protein RecF n=1 Tax=Legionella tunisiensis TaxID=1034944 RepID=UPI0002FF8824|nr:DNA replication/repair protein RecF [Legionella tunisiensis]